MSYPANNQQGQAQQQDEKVFARHVIIRPTNSGGQMLTLFFSQEEAERLYADLGQALDLTAKNEAEGAKISLVTGDGRNGKPFALAGIAPTYPRAQGQAPAPQQAPQQNQRPPSIQPNVTPVTPVAPVQQAANGGYQGRGGGFNRGPAPGRPFSNKKL